MSFDTLKDVSETAKSCVSIPFEQGNVFRHNYWSGVHQEMESLNPFRAGQCLSTSR